MRYLGGISTLRGTTGAEAAVGWAGSEGKRELSFVTATKTMSRCINSSHG